MSIQVGDIIKDGTAVFKVKKFGGGGGLIGRVEWYAGTDTPENYLLCDGSAVSRTDYAELFAVIGTTYGAGDESTTFTLPLLTDGRFIEGSDTAGTNKEAGLPNITGTSNGKILDYTVSTGAINHQTVGGLSVAYSGNASTQSSLLFDASRANAIYGKSDTVQPLALTMRPLIRYAE